MMAVRITTIMNIANNRTGLRRENVLIIVTTALKTVFCDIFYFSSQNFIPIISYIINWNLSLFVEEFRTEQS